MSSTTPGAGDVLATAVGLLQESGHAARMAAGRVAAPSVRAAALGLRLAARMPGVSRVRGPALRTVEWMAGTAETARERGRETLTGSRADAVKRLQSTVDDGIRWLVPRVLNRSLPEVRMRLLPAVVEQLTADPRLREFVTEQARVMVERAVDQMGRRRPAMARQNRP